MSVIEHQPSAENPEVFTGLKLSKPATVAAGIPAVVSSLRHILDEMNIVRGMKALLALNQKGGFDCPSCAWPDPDDERSGIAEYCENGAKAVAEEATTKKLTPDFFAKNAVADLALLSDYEIGKKGRVAQPMHLPKGATHYQPITWDDAFERIATVLTSLASPDESIFYTSGRASNEAAFVYQLFVREYGTNNLPDCSNMCHESSGVALTESLGIGKGSVKLEDFYEAEVILILGQNPGTNHPRMLTALQKAKRAGAIIISVNPLPEAGLMGFDNPQQVKGVLGIDSTLTDLFLQVKLNGDMALLQAIEAILLQEELKAPGTVFDHDFIAKNTKGYEAFKAYLQQVDIAQMAKDCDVPLDQIEDAATILKGKTKIIACWAMGLTQHRNAVDTIKEVVNLLLLKGSIGKPGAGTCPVRGHSNVQGDRTMGIYEKVAPSLRKKINEVYGFNPPEKDGYDTVAAIKAMHSGDAKVFFALGGNFLSATPDTLYTADALRQCLLTVQLSTKLNRSHLVHGQEAIILPCYGRSDEDVVHGEAQFVSCENSMGVIQMSKGILKPVSKALLSEPAIICRLAQATLGSKSKIPWDSYLQHYDHIRTDIERVIPGFEDYNRRVQEPGGFYLPNSAREGTWNTESKLASFEVAVPEKRALKEGELMMMTIRSHDQFNTTIYGLHDRYRGVHNERRIIFMNRADIAAAGFAPNEVVDLINDADGVVRVAKGFIIVPYSIPRQCTATYFPETNVLVPINDKAYKSHTPVSKCVIIRLRKAAE